MWEQSRDFSQTCRMALQGFGLHLHCSSGCLYDQNRQQCKV